jgi:molybdenum cofactor cytidylyltransferase
MICLSDLPLIESEELNYLIQAFEKVLKENNRSIVVPAFDGQRGNPVIFSASYKVDILDYKELTGCKGVVKQNSDHVLEVEMGTDHVLKDMDTVEDYEKIRKVSKS